MTLILDRERFTAAVTFAARALPRSVPHPALNGLHIAVTPGGVMVSAFDYDTYAEASAGPGSDELDLLLPGRTLASYLAGMTAPTVTLDIDGTSVLVASGAAKVKLRTLRLEDYPTPPDLPASIGTVDASALAAAFTHVKDSIDDEKSLPALMGIRMEATDGVLTVAGVSRYRLVARDVDWSGGDDFNVLLPLSSIDTAKALADEVVIGVTDGRVSLGDADRLACIRTLAGDPPNWRRLLDVPTPDLIVTIDRAQFVEALRFVALGAGRRDETLCSLDIGTDSVGVSLFGSEGLDATAEVDAKVDGDGFTCKYKPGYLLDAMAGTTAATMTFAFSGPNRPAHLTAEADAAFRALAMPVKS